jgi:transcriptional regulator of acetoin/glycerol metabolism
VVRAAARAAGIDRVHLYRMLARHGLRRDTD